MSLQPKVIYLVDGENNTQSFLADQQLCYTEDVLVVVFGNKDFQKPKSMQPLTINVKVPHHSKLNRSWLWICRAQSNNPQAVDMAIARQSLKLLDSFMSSYSNYWLRELSPDNKDAIRQYSSQDIKLFIVHGGDKGYKALVDELLAENSRRHVRICQSIEDLDVIRPVNPPTGQPAHVTLQSHLQSLGYRNCPYCQAILSKQAPIDNHYRDCSQLHLCIACSVYCTDTTMHPKCPYGCMVSPYGHHPVCLLQLPNHMDTFHPKCTTCCTERFSSPDKLAEHVVAKKFEVKCELCAHVSANQWDAKEHAHSHLVRCKHCLRLCSPDKLHEHFATYHRGLASSFSHY